MTEQPTPRPDELKREFNLWSTFAMAFAFISPIVALYAIFALAFAAAGPATWWGFLFVLGGQLLVALVFAELASKWPFEGSVYQWARRLQGETYGWFTGWAYMWTLIIAMATVAYGAAGFLPTILGTHPFSTGVHLMVAIGIVAFGTLANTAGRRWMKLLVAASIAAEVIGSIGIGSVLLLFHREHGFGDLFHGFGAHYGPGPQLWSGMLAAMAFIGWAFVGFESAGAIAEEVHEPRRDVPRAIILSLVIVAVVVMYAALGLILAIPDYGKVLDGTVADPVAETITAQLGSGITRPLFVLFIIGFLASLLALQAASSRVMWSFARDRVLPGSGHLARLSDHDRLPVNAIAVTGVGAGLVLLTTLSSDVYATLVNFTTGGFYVAFAFPVLGALACRMRGGLTAGTFNLGRWGMPVGLLAALWIVFALVNVAWPRATDLPWYQEYGVLVMIAVVGGAGALVYLGVRQQVRAADAPVAQELELPSAAVPDTVGTVS